MNSPEQPSADSESELTAMRSSALRFFEENVVPHYSEWEKRGYIDRDIWRKAGSAGILCPSISEANGGLGGNLRHSRMIIEALARSNCDLPGIFLHSDIVTPYIERLGSLEQKAQWLPGCITGDVITCIAISEPDAGSDMRSIRTRAFRDGSDWIIRGQKTFITNGWLADLALVVANTGDKTISSAKSIFLVPTDSAGFRRGRLLEKIGQKAQDTAELFFDDVRVPDSGLLGDVDRGLNYLMQELGRERLVIAISGLAIAQTIFDHTVDYVSERRAFGKTIGELQSTRHALAEIKTELEVGRAFVDECVDDDVAGRLTPVRASMAKMWLTDLQGRVIDRCLQLFGGYGYMWEYPVARAFANARGQRIYGGANEIMKEIIARSIMQK